MDYEGLEFYCKSGVHWHYELCQFLGAANDARGDILLIVIRH